MLDRINKALRGAADHPIRHVAQNSLLLLPGMRRLQMRIATTGAMNEPDLMLGWARQVIDAAGGCGVDIVGAHLAEVGPGHSLGVAVALLLAGVASVSAVDVRAFADPADIEAFRPLAEHCRRIGPARDGEANLEDALKGLKYSIVADDGRWSLPDASQDIVYSYFSGEHLRAPEEILRESHRVLKPGGLCLHAIDLRDHLHFEGNWLRFLCYPPWLWEAMTSRRGQWCNRLRAPEWRALFERWFELVRFEELKRPIPEDFDLSEVAAPFRQHDLDTLSVSNLWVVARKPG